MAIFVINIDGDKPRLIDAPSKKQAIQFALPVVIQAEKASASAVAQMMANGSKVEKAD